MSEATVGEVEEVEVEEDRYRDRSSLEAELQEIARSKAPEPSRTPGFWAKRRHKN
jgi:hypothetical protein